MYVSAWGTGELLQYDVSDPFHPRRTGSVRLGGIVGRTPHPADPAPLTGGPQMVELSRDGRRVYLTNSLYGSWDDQFYPDRGGLAVDPRFFPHGAAFHGRRVHQTHLSGGDASSDSYCFA